MSSNSITTIIVAPTKDRFVSDSFRTIAPKLVKHNKTMFIQKRIGNSFNFHPIPHVELLLTRLGPGPYRSKKSYDALIGSNLMPAANWADIAIKCMVVLTGTDSRAESKVLYTGLGQLT